MNRRNLNFLIVVSLSLTFFYLSGNINIFSASAFAELDGKLDKYDIKNNILSSPLYELPKELTKPSFAKNKKFKNERQKIVFDMKTRCGLEDESQDVEFYDGKLGVTKDYVIKYESSTGQLQWIDDLHTRFNKPGDDQGHYFNEPLSERRWCTGTLISKSLFLTAGHCFDVKDSNLLRTPKKDGQSIKPDEIAKLMRVNFGYQKNGQTGDTRTPNTYPVKSLIEYRVAEFDYAILELGRGNHDKLPGETYGYRTPVTVHPPKSYTHITVFQHPSGSPKRIDTGLVAYIMNRDLDLEYGDLDTFNGSSGAGILNSKGKLIGVHLRGGCSKYSEGVGANKGLSSYKISKVSSIL